MGEKEDEELEKKSKLRRGKEESGKSRGEDQ